MQYDDDDGGNGKAQYSYTEKTEAASASSTVDTLVGTTQSTTGRIQASVVSGQTAEQQQQPQQTQQVDEGFFEDCAGPGGEPAAFEEVETDEREDCS